MIQDSDAYGAMVIDAVYRGIVNCTLQTTVMEWIAGVLTALTPYSASPLPPTGAGYLGPGVIGVLDTSLAWPLVLTATTGTASATMPISLTAADVVIAEQYDVTMLFGPYHRKIPLRLRIYPYVATFVKYFVLA